MRKVALALWRTISLAQLRTEYTAASENIRKELEQTTRYYERGLLSQTEYILAARKIQTNIQGFTFPYFLATRIYGNVKALVATKRPSKS